MTLIKADHNNTTDGCFIGRVKQTGELKGQILSLPQQPVVISLFNSSCTGNLQLAGLKPKCLISKEVLFFIMLALQLNFLRA
jgi:hypothetical protein